MLVADSTAVVLVLIARLTPLFVRQKLLLFACGHWADEAFVSNKIARLGDARRMGPRGRYLTARGFES
jgi:hypothetical protein